MKTIVRSVISVCGVVRFNNNVTTWDLQFFIGKKFNHLPIIKKNNNFIIARYLHELNGLKITFIRLFVSNFSSKCWLSTFEQWWWYGYRIALMFAANAHKHRSVTVFSWRLNRSLVVQFVIVDVCAVLKCIATNGNDLWLFSNQQKNQPPAWNINLQSFQFRIHEDVSIIQYIILFYV